MPSEGETLVEVVVAAIVCAGAVPPLARLAVRTGIIDRPGGYKQHEQATPYLGGLAVLLGVMAATLVTSGGAGPVGVIVAGAAAICALGTIDDWRPVAPRVRLVAQASIAAGVWAGNAGWSLGAPGWVNLALTVGWVLLATNAFNLIDNLDGTSAGAAAASALGVVGVAFIVGANAWAALLAAAVLGACIGFLPFNLARPSRIFLGDGGSTLLGFLLGVAVMGALPAQPSVSILTVAAPLVGMALLDTAFVLVSRRRRGVALFVGGRDHLTHRLRAGLGSDRQVVVLVVAAQTVFSALAVAAATLGGPAILAADLIYCLAVAATISVLDVRRGAAIG